VAGPLWVMNEAEHSVDASCDQETTEQISPISQRGQRRVFFNRHVAQCPTCSDDANQLCPDGHRLLRQAIGGGPESEVISNQ